MSNFNETPWSSVGYLVYKRTYARPLEDGTTEEWPDTIDRIVEACRDQLKVGFTAAEERRVRRYMTELKGTVAGRFLWQLGTTTVDKLGLLSLQNCASVCIDKPVEPFTWCFDALMLGTGVGINIQREYVYKLPPVREDYVGPTRVEDAGAYFIVPDSREGWVELLRRTLTDAFSANHPSGFTYSTQLVRGKGLPIKGFGGVSSGPEDLVQGIGNITGILKARAGKQLRPIDCLDIVNIIGQVVVSGNVRRSAIIAIGDHDDLQYLKAKRWGDGNIPNWRAMSNNSVVCNDISLLPQEFWDNYDGNSEPYGLINLKLSRSCGRVGDTRYKDKKVVAYNPCAEQSLENYETCCLAEVFLPNVTSERELHDLLQLFYRINKHSLTLPCHLKQTEEVVHRNMRMGIGITGYMQATEKQKSWLADAYEMLRQFDKEYSAAKGFPESIKLTTFKPSGTLSLLPGVTPGVHPGFSRYMIRRIRMSSNSPVVDVVRAHGYPVEFQKRFDGTEDHTTVVAEFPMMFPEHAVLAADVTAIDQLEVIKKVQTEWSDNSVSCTVYYRDEELPAIRDYLSKNYNKNFKTLSFLRHSDHGFLQAPLEEITEEKYHEMVAMTKLITSMDASLEFDDSSECESGACPIR